MPIHGFVTPGSGFPVARMQYSDVIIGELPSRTFQHRDNLAAFHLRAETVVNGRQGYLAITKAPEPIDNRRQNEKCLFSYPFPMFVSERIKLPLEHLLSVHGSPPSVCLDTSSPNPLNSHMSIHAMKIPIKNIHIRIIYSMNKFKYNTARRLCQVSRYKKGLDPLLAVMPYAA